MRNEFTVVVPVELRVRLGGDSVSAICEARRMLDRILANIDRHDARQSLHPFLYGGGSDFAGVQMLEGGTVTAPTGTSRCSKCHKERLCEDIRAIRRLPTMVNPTELLCLDCITGLLKTHDPFDVCDPCWPDIRQAEQEELERPDSDET